jgi:hypothetical protein
MPQPVSRLFPKLSQKSDDAQLTLTANAISVLFTANGDSHRPTTRAPKQLSIILQHSFRLILRVNLDNMPLWMLSKHLKAALVSVRYWRVSVTLDCIPFILRTRLSWTSLRLSRLRKPTSSSVWTTTLTLCPL